MVYTFLRALSTRNVIRGEGNLDEAKKFLKGRFCLVEDENGNIYKTIEELENAESIRSKPRAWENYFSTSGPEISEDTDRELPEADQDNTESGTERDNQWD